MKKEVIIPRLGSSDESDEVKILRWLKPKGAKVRKGEALLEVETDKVNVRSKRRRMACSMRSPPRRAISQNSAPWSRLSIKQTESVAHPPVMQTLGTNGRPNLG